MNGLFSSACAEAVIAAVNYFITGTDTAVGKTHVAALLTRALRRAGLDTVALKPICCGARDDVDALCDASDNELSPTQQTDLACLTLAPLVAARLENRGWISVT